MSGGPRQKLAGVSVELGLIKKHKKAKPEKGAAVQGLTIDPLTVGDGKESGKRVDKKQSQYEGRKTETSWKLEDMGPIDEGF